MRSVDAIARRISIVTLLAGLAFPLIGSGCTANVGSGGEFVDDNAPEVDETAIKEDSSVRPSGRFEVSNFAELETQGVRDGYTYAIDVRSDSGYGTRDYGVNDEAPLVIRREAVLKFTRSGSKRYIRLTETDTDGNETSVRFEYKMSRGTLRLRAAHSQAWFSMIHVEEAELEAIDAIKTYYSEDGETVENAPAFQGQLPFRIQLEVDMIDIVWGPDYPASVSLHAVTDGESEQTFEFFMVAEDNDGGGSRAFFDTDGNFLAAGGYSESTEFEWNDQ